MPVNVWRGGRVAILYSLCLQHAVDGLGICPRDAAVRILLDFDPGVLYDRIFGGESLDGDFPLFLEGDADDVEVELGACRDRKIVGVGDQAGPFRAKVDNEGCWFAWDGSPAPTVKLGVAMSCPKVARIVGSLHRLFDDTYVTWGFIGAVAAWSCIIVCR
jgi:hypothetical protein